MLFEGTVVMNGWAKAVVVETGMRTEIGKLAKLSEETKRAPTHAEKMLATLGKRLGAICLGLSGAVIVLGIIFGHNWLNMLLVGVSLAVAAVPEGLPAVVTITFALGVRRLTKAHTLIRKLSATDNLGSVTYICTDKTGTLTKGEMTVKKIFVDNQEIEVEGVGYETKGKFSKQTKGLKKLLEIGALCNHATLVEKDDRKTIIGDPTEGALVVAAAKMGINKKKLDGKYPAVSEISFSAERKMMSTIHIIEGRKYMYSKGAPEVILAKSKYILVNGKERKITKNDAKKIRQIEEKYSKEGLRILAMAYKKVKGRGVEKDLVFVGMQAMMDPPRKEVPDAIKVARRAGIKIIMITGDYKETAIAVANKIGLMQKGSIAVDGRELEKMSEEELKQKIEKIKIFARTSPEQKMKILNVLRAKGETVAMTGDGINDAPALKRADVGIAMGITGTDVTKESADVVLVDDNFASIVKGIAEGRGIAMNIRRFVYYLISSNLGEIWIVFFAMLFKWPLILLAVQLLWMNLVTDSVSALALGMEPKEKDIMKRPPRDPKAPIISAKSFSALFGISWVKTIWVLWIFGLLFNINLTYARTMAFLGTILSEKFNLFNFKSFDKPLYKVSLKNNPYLLGAVLVTVALTAIVVQIPSLAKLLHIQPLTLNDWVLLIALASIVLFVGEIYKNIIYFFFNRAGTK